MDAGSPDPFGDLVAVPMSDVALVVNREGRGVWLSSVISTLVSILPDPFGNSVALPMSDVALVGADVVNRDGCGVWPLQVWLSSVSSRPSGQRQL